MRKAFQAKGTAGTKAEKEVKLGCPLEGTEDCPQQPKSLYKATVFHRRKKRKGQRLESFKTIENKAVFLHCFKN